MPSLVIEEKPLRGHVESRIDEVIVVLRAGRVLDIYGPGARARTLWPAYPLGRLTYARIRSSTVLEITIPSVAVTDGWVLPQIAVTASLALNAENGYAALRDRLTNQGLGSIAALSGPLSGEMEQLVRDLISRQTHEQIVVGDRSEGWGAGAKVLTGLLLVEKVHVTATTPDPMYELTRVARQRQELRREDERQHAEARLPWDFEQLDLDRAGPLELAKIETQLELERLRLEAHRAKLEAELEVQAAAIKNVSSLARAARDSALRSRGRPRPERNASVDRWDTRVFEAELENHGAGQPLHVGAEYTLAFGIYPRSRPQAVASGVVADHLLNDATQDGAIVELTVQLDTDDFDISQPTQPLIVPRSGQSLNEARFQVVPLHDGHGILTATLHREGNFIHQLKVTLPVGTQVDPGIESSSVGRPVAAAEVHSRRDLGFVVEPAKGGGYECRAIGRTVGHAYLPITDEQLAGAVDAVRSAMVRVVEFRDGNRFPFSDALDISEQAETFALETLARAGARLFQQIFQHPEGGEDARRLGEGLRRMVASDSHQLQFQVVSRQFPVPWGLLYLGDVRRGADLSWNLFLGMSHLVECIPFQNGFPALDTAIASEPRLSVSINVNAAIDEEFQVDYVERQRAWWSHISASQPRVQVVPRRLRDEVLKALADDRCTDQIFYLYCHANASGPRDPGGIDASALVLTDGRLTLADLNLEAPADAQLVGNPLIVINACESAEMTPRFYDGFVPYFMSKGARGVIGTECKIPALFASEWADRFFDRFLDGQSLGETVLSLRRSFLANNRNPLGLIYTIHCDGDTAITPALLGPASSLPAPVDDLARDPRLLVAWKRAGGPGRAVKGIVRVEEAERSLVVLQLDASFEIAEHDRILLEAFPNDDAFVLPCSSNLLDWVMALVRQRAPEIAEWAGAWTLEERDASLHIRVGHQEAPGGGVVKAILSEGTLIVPALCALLPYDDVVCSAEIL